MKIPERTKKSKSGLVNYIKYIQSFYDTKELTILEIGSWTGVSACIFAQYFKHVVCIDPWKATKGINTKYNMKDVEDIFDNRMKHIKNIRKIKDKSENVVQKINNKFDIIYIDGIHTYEAVKKDILMWKDKTNLFISGHDYWRNKFPGVIKAVNEILGIPDKVFCDTSWIKKV
jgi:hypothetical protein